MRSPRSFPTAVFDVLLAACSNGTDPGPGPSLDCTAASAEALAVGEHRILDPNQADACVRLPAAGPSGAQHFYVPVATEGTVADEGMLADYTITGASLAAAAVQGLPSPSLSVPASWLSVTSTARWLPSVSGTR